MESQSETTQTVSALKLSLLRTRDDSVSSVASASAEAPIPHKTVEQKLVRKNELKAKSTLMLAISDEHLLKFHAFKGAKSLCEAIKNRFGGNMKSKKMQKTILKQNYKNFPASSQEGLDKTYDRFQKLISQLEIHGEVISQEDANLNQISAIDKTGLGYDGQVNESEVLNSVFNSRESDEDDNQVNDEFKISEGYHAVPLSYTRNYMPPKANLSFAGLDNLGFKSNKLGDGFEFKKKACFVYGSINHLIKDCDFYEKKMVMNNKGKITGPEEIKPVWDNTARVNHQNKLTHPHPKRNFVPATVLTKSGQVPVNTAKQSSHRASAAVSTARHVNIIASRPHMNDALQTTYSYFKAHSPVRRPLNQKSTAKTNSFNEKVNTGKVNNVTTVGEKAVVSAVEGNMYNVVQSSACWI
nr:hypothetical protein [Tanacetum cinerariifolium]